MFNKVGTKALLLVVVVLAGLYLLADRYSLRAKDRTFREYVVQVDTTTVVSFSLHPRRAGGDELRFERTPAGWTVQHGDTLRPADDELVRTFLGPFTGLRAKRMVGGIKLVGERHELTDSLRNRAEFRLVNGDPVQLDIGRSTFAPGEEGAWTFVHVPGEKDVFATPGTLQMLADRILNEWRPHHLVRGDTVGFRRLTYTFPSDTGYVMELGPEGWTIDGKAADQYRLGRYLESLSGAQAMHFADDADITGLSPAYRLEIDDVDRTDPIVVEVFPWRDGFVVTSSLNPGSVMAFDAEREVPRLFRPRSAFQH